MCTLLNCVVYLVLWFIDLTANIIVNDVYEHDNTVTWIDNKKFIGPLRNIMLV